MDLCNALSLRYVCLRTFHKARLALLQLWTGADVALSCTVLCLVLYEIRRRAAVKTVQIPKRESGAISHPEKKIFIITAFNKMS
jgi:hypothetical protein